MKAISVELGLPRYPPRSTIARKEDKARYCRIATRSPPTGHWVGVGGGGIPFHRELYRKYEKKPKDPRKRFSQGSRKTGGEWYDNDRDSPPGRASSPASDRAGRSVRILESASDHGPNESVDQPREPQPNCLCD